MRTPRRLAGDPPLTGVQAESSDLTGPGVVLKSLRLLSFPRDSQTVHTAQENRRPIAPNLRKRFACLAELVFHRGAGFTEIHAPRVLLFQRGHDLAHFLEAGGADAFDRFFDRLERFVFA